MPKRIKVTKRAKTTSKRPKGGTHVKVTKKRRIK